MNLRIITKNHAADPEVESRSIIQNHKIDLKAQWPRNDHADSVGVKSFKIYCSLFSVYKNGNFGTEIQ